MKFFSIRLLALCLSIIGDNDAKSIVLFTDSYFQGREFVVHDISRCSNLPGGAVANTNSVNTRGNCVRLYAKWDCAGAFVEILARSPSHGSLGTWNFNERAKSVGPCRDTCDKDVTGYEVWEQPPPQDIKIFSQKHYIGTSKTVRVNGCTRIPQEFVHNVKSVKIGGASCIQFYDNQNCLLDWEGTNNHTDTIELRKGTPSHGDISIDWFFKEARAVSHCNLKCQKKYQKKSTPGFGEVVLFNQTNFTGNWMKLKLDQCVNLTAPWEGSVMSIKMPNQSCLAMHEGTGCTGNFANVLYSSANLSDDNFVRKAKSLQPCQSVSADGNSDAPIVSEVNQNATIIQAGNQTTDVTITVSNQTQIDGTEEVGEVFLFSQRNFTGKFMKLKLEECVNLMGPWKGSVLSIKMPNKTCVAIHERKGCEGDFTKVLDSSPNLSDENFAKRAKSLQPCLIESVEETNDVSTVSGTNTNATVVEAENQTTDATMTSTNHTEYPEKKQEVSEENLLKRKLQSCPDIFDIWNGVKLSAKMLLHQIQMFSKMFEEVRQDSNETQVAPGETRKREKHSSFFMEPNGRKDDMVR